VDALAAVLLPDRRQPIVVYGTATSASAAAVAKRLEELGYTTVALYRGGKEDWVGTWPPAREVNTDNRKH
jgi:rhodanese-related sulfurtransferase